MTGKYVKNEQAVSDLVSIQHLITQLSDKNGQTREKARYALAQMGQQAVSPLLEVYSTSDYQQRWEICKTLSMIGDPAAMPIFLEALEDESFEIRWLAAEGVIAIGRKFPEKLEAVLHALLAQPGSAWLREGAYHIFHTLVLYNNQTEFKPLVKALSNFDWEIKTPAAVIQVLHDLDNKTV